MNINALAVFLFNIWMIEQSRSKTAQTATSSLNAAARGILLENDTQDFYG